MSHAEELKLRRRQAFGDVVRRRRKSLGYSQERLGNEAGADRQSINRWELAKNSPCVDEIWRLADALHMTLGEMFTATENILNPPTQQPVPCAPRMVHGATRKDHV